uniref:receptor protein serine/threonine kinase n=1 Tax=Heterorhabditis bacteriophora TaxID=37862 RepID=A0A1I7X775_HETBA
MGTVRYMAPELLQGSINLFDPIISLPQIDTYACGIVLWEILWRCADLWKTAVFVNCASHCALLF